MMSIERYTRVLFKAAIYFALCFVIPACPAADETHNWSEQEQAILHSLWLKRLPKVAHDQTNRVAGHDGAAEFGHRIFFDTRFSANGKVACASCHQPKHYFTDTLRTSRGIATVKRNAPTIVGISYSHWFFLDGRADSLWSQALGPLENALEHGGDRSRYAHLVFDDPLYRQAYESLFGAMPDLLDYKRFPLTAGPVDDSRVKQAWQKMQAEDRKAITQVFVNIGKALAAYEALLKPAPSRFDRYVQALSETNQSQLQEIYSDEEANGLRLFIGKANCVICHSGPLLSDFEFHNIGVPALREKVYDWGRYQGAHQVMQSQFNCYGEYNDAMQKSCAELDYIITDKDHTIGSFRTPGLRNISKTAPYMHAGQYQTLQDVLKHYSDPPQTQIGRGDILPLKIRLDENEQQQLLAFLKTLDSDIAAGRRWLSAP